MNETELVQRIRLAIGQDPDVVAWRNSTGVLAADFGAKGHRRVRYGLCEGSADLICIVAPYGRFVALEVKSATGKIRNEQIVFGNLVERMGGIWRVVRSVEDALEAIDEAKGSRFNLGRVAQ